jgi:tetratricopeptide (TPR) repeat protein
MAEADLRSALARDPDLARAAAELSQILFDRGRHAEAMSWAQRAYDNDRYLAGTSRLIDQLARSKFELGNDLEAIELCRDGVRRYPDNPAHPGCILEIMAWGTLPANPDSARVYHRALTRLAREANTELTVYYGMAMASVLARAGERDSAASVVERTRREVEQNIPRGHSLHTKLLAWEAGVRFRLGDSTQANALLARLRNRDSSEARVYSTRRMLRSYLPSDSAAGPR